MQTRKPLDYTCFLKIKFLIITVFTMKHVLSSMCKYVVISINFGSDKD